MWNSKDEERAGESFPLTMGLKIHASRLERMHCVIHQLEHEMLDLHPSISEGVICRKFLEIEPFLKVKKQDCLRLYDLFIKFL